MCWARTWAAGTTDDRTEALFDERRLQGGGYTWQGIVTALIQLHAPELLGQLRVLDAEADNMYAYCSDRAVLERVASLVRSAIADQKVARTRWSVT